MRLLPGRSSILILLVPLGMGFQALAAQAQPSEFKEYEVKAAFVYNFGKFVDWPVAAFAGEKAPLTIGILGQDPFGPALEDLVRDGTIQNRPIQVKHFGRIEELTACHILFISQSEKPRLAAILNQLEGRPILTVGDTERFLRDGGIINLRLEEGQIRFDIDLDAAKRAGLKISAQLLKLAGLVRSQSAPQERR